MTVTGRCQCGAISYVAEGEPLHHALCHCADCRKASGALVTGWIAYKDDAVTISGTPVTYASSANARRQFCGTCGTGLFYTNAEMLPGIIDIQSATLDDPEASPPRAHIQVAERLGWMADAGDLPQFARYPGM